MAHFSQDKNLLLDRSAQSVAYGALKKLATSCWNKRWPSCRCIMWPALGMTTYFLYGFGSCWKNGRRPSGSATSSYSPWMSIVGTGMSLGLIMGMIVTMSSWGPVGVFTSTCAAALAKASTTAGSLAATGVMEENRGFQPASGIVM